VLTILTIKYLVIFQAQVNCKTEIEYKTTTKHFPTRWSWSSASIKAKKPWLVSCIRSKAVLLNTTIA